VSDSLPIADHLLARARLMVRIGRPADARRLLRRALVDPGLSNRSRSDVLRQTAGIEVAAGRFRRARRLLAAAIRLRRHADELYVEYARAVSADPDGDPRLAVKALRRAVGIDPFEAGSWAALGAAAGRAGASELARKAFRRAARLRPDSVAVLNEIVDGFLDLGREGDARAVLTAAHFRSPNDAAVVAVWDRFRFTLAARRQSQGQADGPTILPFSAPPREATAVVGEAIVLRADRQSTPTPHLLRMLGRRFDPRQAQ
jgi:tetratricopeptide (TPR) repeat protein